MVGADRIAKNGDTANKVRGALDRILFAEPSPGQIGTYNAAVLAARHKIPFLVIAPTSTIDLNTVDGSGYVLCSPSPVFFCVDQLFLNSQDPH